MAVRTAAIFEIQDEYRSDIKDIQETFETARQLIEMGFIYGNASSRPQPDL